MYIIIDSFVMPDQTAGSDILAVCSSLNEARECLKGFAEGIDGSFDNEDCFRYDEKNCMCINFNSAINNEVYVLECTYDCDCLDSSVLGVYSDVNKAKADLIDDIHNTFDDAFNDDVADGNYDRGSNVVDSIGALSDGGMSWYLDSEYDGYYTYNLNIYKRNVQ